MGSRLGVLLKTYSGWEIYYDHWAAQTVGLDIAIDGMEATYERVRCMSPMGVDDPHAWEGAPWIEGTLLIDETRKLVAWAEESEALYMPRLINYLVEHTWPGWTAAWSAEGTRGTLRAAGVDPATIFTHRSDRLPCDRWMILLDAVLRISWLWLARSPPGYRMNRMRGSRPRMTMFRPPGYSWTTKHARCVGGRSRTGTCTWRISMRCGRDGH